MTDVWVKVEVDRSGTRIEYVGDKSLMDETLKNAIALQHAVPESDEVAISRDRSISTVQMRSADTALESQKSKNQLYTWCVWGLVVSVVVFILVSCGGRKSDSNTSWDGTVDRLALHWSSGRMDG